MRITSKGQVTIPAHIRETTGLMPNTEVNFVVARGSVKLVRATSKAGKPSRGAAVLARLRGHKGSGQLSTDQIMKMMRGNDWPDLR